MWQALNKLLGIVKQMSCSICPQGAYITEVLTTQCTKWESVWLKLSEKFSLSWREFSFWQKCTENRDWWEVRCMLWLDFIKILAFILNSREVLGVTQWNSRCNSRIRQLKIVIPMLCDYQRVERQQHFLTIWGKIIG